MAAETEASESSGLRWFSRSVGGIGIPSFLADLGHVVLNALLPTLLALIPHAPAALGLIEDNSMATGRQGSALPRVLSRRGMCAGAWPYSNVRPVG